MEKIKQALDKARQERESNNTQIPSPASGKAKSVSTIQYTKTQSVDSSPVLMRENRLISTMEQGKYTDALKILSTQVLHRMEENQWGSIAVTSPRLAAGKTTIAINLGLSIAKEVDYSVLLVDANLRHPNIHQYFGIEPEYGLSDYLTNEIELSDILINPRGIDRFVLLPAGKPHPMSTELLGSPRMCDLVKELTSKYPKRIIIFDLPSILLTADALAFMPCVDCSLVVIEDDVTKESDLKAAIEILSVTNVIGTVLNKSSY
jgi:protein-tyrosine kinase